MERGFWLLVVATTVALATGWEHPVEELPPIEPPGQVRGSPWPFDESQDEDSSFVLAKESVEKPLSSDDADSLISEEVDEQQFPLDGYILGKLPKRKVKGGHSKPAYDPKKETVVNFATSSLKSIKGKSFHLAWIPNAVAGSRAQIAFAKKRYERVKKAAERKRKHEKKVKEKKKKKLIQEKLRKKAKAAKAKEKKSKAKKNQLERKAKRKARRRAEERKLARRQKKCPNNGCKKKKKKKQQQKKKKTKKKTKKSTKKTTKKKKSSKGKKGASKAKAAAKK